LKLYQIPFSHNCVKVRKALDLKSLEYETLDIHPILRIGLRRASGQALVPALVDGGRAIADSTAILLYLEERYPDPPLLPAEPEARAECLILEHWADETFMALTRRLAYWNVTASPGALGELFFPKAPRRIRHVAGRVAKFALHRRLGMSSEQNSLDEREAPRAAELAVARLGGREHLVDQQITIADIALASMSAPLQFAVPAVRNHPAVQELMAWGRRLLEIDREFTAADTRPRSARLSQPRCLSRLGRIREDLKAHRLSVTDRPVVRDAVLDGRAADFPAPRETDGYDHLVAGADEVLRFEAQVIEGVQVQA
jgi:glutathione S-transferase